MASGCGDRIGPQSWAFWLPDLQTDGNSFRSCGTGLSCCPGRQGPMSVSRKRPQSHMFRARCSACLCLFKDAGTQGEYFCRGAEPDTSWVLCLPWPEVGVGSVDPVVSSTCLLLSEKQCGPLGIPGFYVLYVCWCPQFREVGIPVLCRGQGIGEVSD